MNAARRQTAAVFGLGVFVRVLAAVVTTATTLNPESRADATRFEQAAETVAAGLAGGRLVAPGGSYIVDLWGAFLSPFWLVPGPSGLYARLALVTLGAVAAYNVYVIAHCFHSHRAGIAASLPLLFFPSVVAVQSTLLREAFVLFCITTACRLLLLHRRRVAAYAAAGGLLYGAYVMRTENAVIYAAAIVTALLVAGLRRLELSRSSVAAAAGVSAVGVVVARPVIEPLLRQLAVLRLERANGRAVYLGDVAPQTLPELLAFSWIGAAYFLYAPLPWMVETGSDLLVGFEGLLTLGYTVAAIWGVRWLARRDAPAAAGLVAGLAVAVVLYGVGTANYGTGMRHRQMFTWVLFTLGAVGVAERVRLRLPTRDRHESGVETG